VDRARRFLLTRRRTDRSNSSVGGTGEDIRTTPELGVDVGTASRRKELEKITPARPMFQPFAASKTCAFDVRDPEFDNVGPSFRLTGKRSADRSRLPTRLLHRDAACSCSLAANVWKP
jgi:hypothetical protein